MLTHLPALLFSLFFFCLVLLPPLAHSQEAPRTFDVTKPLTNRPWTIHRRIVGSRGNAKAGASSDVIPDDDDDSLPGTGEAELVLEEGTRAARFR